MVVSMTGYGCAKKELNDIKVTVEVKSVNHRFCELSVRMPRQFMIFEDKMKRIVQEYIQRGRIDVFVTLEGQGFTTKNLEVDWELVQEYVNKINEAKKRFNFKGDPSVDNLLQLEEVFNIIEKEDGIEDNGELLLSAVREAAIELYQMRKIEGEQLQQDLLKRLTQIDNVVEELIPLSTEIIGKYRERLLKKVSDFLSGTLEVDEGRIVTEVALFADKSDINEELTRLKSHSIQFKQIISQEGTIGRKLDFLVQEMNREMNTIGSKSNDVHISQKVVDMKSDLEKIKEQVQNIE